MSTRQLVLSGVAHSKEVEAGIKQIIGLCTKTIIVEDADRNAKVAHAVREIIAAAVLEGIGQQMDERNFGREAKTPCYVTFYTATGYAIRETMQSATMGHMDGRLHAQINRKAKELGAHHWAIFKHWVSFDVPYTPAELEAMR